ncbi:MAG TPA: glycosyltransferase, partial [Hyphomicrobiaceae bacterium]|nr:glycosyltransferase [Hyphomicrobiaceae bacterium]
LPNTVGEIFTPGDGSALREKWNLDGKRVLLTVGRMDSRERYKGHDRVIRALPQLIAVGHDVIYVVIGEGDDLPRLKSLAVETGVADRVRFMGPAGPETLVQAYRMADIFVMPSTGEGFGIAFLEAMACGTPALGLATGGALDALVDGELGGAVDEAEFVSTLMEALQKPKPDGCALAAAARERFGREHFEQRAKAVVCGLVQAEQEDRP